MRPIKFRAWCEMYRVMLYDLNSLHLIHGELKDPDNTYEFMQFTGLLDIEEKEIFDGDILTIEQFKFYVSYDEGCFVVQENPKTEMYFAVSNINKFSIIIGNIHETPELLEHKN